MTYYEDSRTVVRDSRSEDIEAVGSDLRPGEVAECREATGTAPLEAVALSYAYSDMAYTVEVDGKPVAMFGACPYQNADYGAQVWFLGANGIGAIRKTFLRQTPRFIARMLEKYPVLSNCAPEEKDYPGTMRWLKRFGAQFSENAYTNPNGAVFRYFEFRRA